MKRTTWPRPRPGSPPRARSRPAGPRRPAGQPADLLNSRLEGSDLEAFAAPDEPGRALLTRAAETSGLAARGWTRTLRLARTIADLDGSSGVRRIHVAEALIYRRSGMDVSGDAVRRPVRA